MLALINDTALLFFIKYDVMKNVATFPRWLNAVVRKLFSQLFDQHSFICKADFLRGGVLQKHLPLFF